MSKEVEGVVLKSVLQGLSECHFCKGVVFTCVETVLWFSNLSRADREKMRERVADGMNLEGLRQEFDFYEDEWNSSICEKCGRKTSDPTKGGP